MSYNISNVSQRRTKPEEEPKETVNFRAGLERVKSKLGKRPRKEPSNFNKKVEKVDPVMTGMMSLCAKIKELEARIEALEN